MTIVVIIVYTIESIANERLTGMHYGCKLNALNND